MLLLGSSQNFCELRDAVTLPSAPCTWAVPPPGMSDARGLLLFSFEHLWFWWMIMYKEILMCSALMFSSCFPPLNFRTIVKCLSFYILKWLFIRSKSSVFSSIQDLYGFLICSCNFFDTQSSQESGNKVVKLRRYLNVYPTECAHYWMCTPPKQCQVTFLISVGYLPLYFLIAAENCCLE